MIWNCDIITLTSLSDINNTVVLPKYSIQCNLILCAAIMTIRRCFRETQTWPRNKWEWEVKTRLAADDLERDRTLRGGSILLVLCIRTDLLVVTQTSSSHVKKRLMLQRLEANVGEDYWFHREIRSLCLVPPRRFHYFFLWITTQAWWIPTQTQTKKIKGGNLSLFILTKWNFFLKSPKDCNLPEFPWDIVGHGNADYLLDEIREFSWTETFFIIGDI